MESSQKMKMIFLIRHGQSTFNAAEATGLVQDPFLPDARLTPHGMKQAEDLSTYVRTLPELDLIIASPLTRAIQTALIVFKERLPKTPLIINAEQREFQTGSDDLGRTPEELKQEFPQIDFSPLKKIWWYNGRTTKGEDVDPNESKERFKKTPFREPDDQCKQRSDQWRTFLAGRKESRIAVVAHSDFIHSLINVYVDNCQLFKTIFDPNTLIFYPMILQEVTLNKRLLTVKIVDYKEYVEAEITDLQTGIIFQNKEEFKENNPIDSDASAQDRRSKTIDLVVKQFKNRFGIREMNESVVWIINTTNVKVVSN